MYDSLPFLFALFLISSYLLSSTVTTKYAWKEPGIGRNLIYMGITGVVCFIILLIIEYRVFEGVSYYISSFFERELPAPASQTQIDSDVDTEKKRVKQMTMADLEANNLVLQSLSKYYGKFLAVNQLSIGIQRYVHVQHFTDKNDQVSSLVSNHTEPSVLVYLELMGPAKRAHLKC